jgi:hypothetical protein
MHGAGRLIKGNGDVYYLCTYCNVISITCFFMHLRYEGEMKEGKACGYGKYSFQDGTTYKGEWIDDNFHGIGEIMYPNK